MIKPIALFILIQLFSLSTYADNNDKIVTQGDLQHHRWILESINNSLPDTEKLNNTILDLDFGERMMVSYNTGCGQYSGQARLLDEMFSINIFKMNPIQCDTVQAQLDSLLYQVFTHGSKINITSEKKLTLETDNTKLIFKPRDWVH